MKGKTKITFAVIPVAVSAIALSLVLINSKKSFTKMTADPSVYEITLDSNAAASGLTNNFQKSVDAPFTTARGSVLNFKLTNAKAYAGEGSGYVTLGNYGSVYCCTPDEHHISGIGTIKVTYSSGNLSVRGTNANTDDGAAYITNGAVLQSGVAIDYSINPLNAIIITAGEGNVNIQKIEIGYTCSANDQPFEYDKVYNVEDFENYSATGVGYDGSHGMGTSTGLRSQFYSVYYGAGTNPLSGKGWAIMGSSDYLTYHPNAGRNGSKTALFKSNSGNYFEYVQAKHFFGIPYAIGKGAKLSAWIHGAYADTNGTPGAAATVTLIAYYNNMLKLGDGTTNEAATATYTINGSSDWTEYTVDLDPTKTVFAFGIHIAKATATLYLPVDDVKIYTESPYGKVDVTGISLNMTSANLLVGETRKLIPTVTPADATDKSFAVTNSNPDVATINASGVVTAVGLGSTTITATTNDGGFTASCVVNVTEPYPDGTFFNTVTVSTYNIKIEVICSTRVDCVVYFYGMATDGARFTSYNSSTGAFVITIDGEADLGALGTYTYGTMTGFYRNNQLEEVGLTGTISSLLGAVNNTITLPRPTNNFWNCDGTTSELQSTFKRRYRYNNAWSVDTGNADRITPDAINKTSGTNGLKLRGYASGIALSLNSDLNGGNGIAQSNDFNTFACWIYNPGTTDTSIQVYLFKQASLNAAANLYGDAGKVIPAQSWVYIRIGFGWLNGATVYNFSITNLPSPTAEPLYIDDIWFHN